MKNSLLILCLAILSFSCETDDEELQRENQCDCTRTTITYIDSVILTQQQVQLRDDCDKDNTIVESTDGDLTITQSWDCN